MGGWGGEACSFSSELRIPEQYWSSGIRVECAGSSLFSHWAVTPPGQPRFSTSRLLLALLPDAAGWRGGKAGRPVPKPPGLRVPLPRPCSRPPSVPGRRPRPSGRRGEAPPTAKSRPPPAKGAGGVRHWPPSGGMLQLRRSAHRKNTQEQRFASCSGLDGTVRDTGRSWRRRRGCWIPGRLAGPLGGSPRTTCFWEGSAHGPPVPASRGRLRGVRYTPLPQLLGAGCGAADEGAARRNLPGATGRYEARGQSS